ncbi:hypothetical protein [Synechococcus sp. C9]|jgi:hypothetical protein|uniref:hypothetical protein n=1 Tax=Synechococcus sp. C9 TaxID=102119 RepID=UPI001FF21589|nr:hypothetical protein [Synechococcus sp. C9]
MTERLGKRVSRSITFYPTPEDSQLLEELDRRAAAQQVTFSELCKMALHQFVQGDGREQEANPYTVCFEPHETALQQQIEAELTAQGISFSDWVKQRLVAPPPTSLESRVQHLEAVIAQLQHQPPPPTRQEIEQMIAQMLEPIRQAPLTPPMPPPPPKPTTDSLIAELSTLLVDDF